MIYRLVEDNPDSWNRTRTETAKSFSKNSYRGNARTGIDRLGIGARGDGFQPIDGMIEEFVVTMFRRYNKDDATKLYGDGSGIAWPPM
jgi:hypothetical protein